MENLFSRLPFYGPITGRGLISGVGLTTDNFSGVTVKCGWKSQ